MLNVLEEMGYDSMATVLGDEGPSWWKTEQAARTEAASSSAAASAEAAAQQRQDQRQMQAEADAEGEGFQVTFCVSRARVVSLQHAEMPKSHCPHQQLPRPGQLYSNS